MKKSESIEEMCKTCNIMCGDKVKDWDDKKVEEYYQLYKQRFFNLK